MTTKQVTTPALQVGDIVHVYGGRFRLTACRFTEADAAERIAHYRKAAQDMPHRADSYNSEAERHDGSRAFDSEFVGKVPGSKCSIPESWRRPWIVQGNARATWAVETIEA